MDTYAYLLTEITEMSKNLASESKRLKWGAKKLSLMVSEEVSCRSSSVCVCVLVWRLHALQHDFLRASALHLTQIRTVPCAPYSSMCSLIIREIRTCNGSQCGVIHNDSWIMLDARAGNEVLLTTSFISCPIYPPPFHFFPDFWLSRLFYFITSRLKLFL